MKKNKQKLTKSSPAKSNESLVALAVIVMVVGVLAALMAAAKFSMGGV